MENYFAIMILGTASILGACQGARTPPPAPNHLIMLTEAEDGSADASFMTVETLEECEERAAAARKVFPVAEIKYISHYCTSAQASFEPFLHNPEPTGPNYIFDLNFSKDGKSLKEVTAHPSMEACKKAGGKVCVISYQNIL